MKTPYFRIDEARLKKNLNVIKQVEQDAGVEIILALKAWAFWPSFYLFKDVIHGAAASSYNEARLIFDALGFKAHTFSTVFSDDEFDAICGYSSHIIFNSVGQFKKFKTQGISNKVSMGLRINPEWSDVKVDLYNPASKSSRLGVTAQALGDFWDESIEGLHCHVLCESTSFALENVLKNIEEKFGHLLNKIKWLNLGGGHFMTSEKYDVPHLVSILKAFKAKYNLKITMEPGAAFVLDAGELVVSVIDIVDNGGEKIACLDTSFTCHMPDTLEMPYKPIALSENEDGPYDYIFGGTSCLAGDYIRGFKFDHELQVGEQIEFKDMLQYTLVKTTFFNGVKHPSVWLKQVNGEMKLLREYNYDDYKNQC